MSEHTPSSPKKTTDPATPTTISTYTSQPQQPFLDKIQRALTNPTYETMTPDVVMFLQRRMGNAAVNRIISRIPAANPEPSLQRTAHERGCSCPSCSRMQLKRDVIQRDGDGTGGGSVKEKAAAFEKESATKDFQPATLIDEKAMKKLATAINVADFKTLAASKSIEAKNIMIALINYFSPLALSDLEPLLVSMDAEAKKSVWSKADLMTKAEGKLGTDPYLTFATKLGMHHPPTTDELYEGGEEHTPAAEADRIIRSKMDKYVAEAVKAGKKIEGQVAVVSDADWDRAGIAHYGDAVWKTGPPPKTPKKDAINGFVDSQGRVWVERNSGNPGTIIHEGLHKYSGKEVLSKLGFYINEGITEYFTRIICKDLSINRGNYDSQYAVIETLVKNVASEEILAKAYFDNDIAGLKDAFIKYRKDTESDSDEDAQNSWTEFIQFFRNGDYSNASQYIKK